MGCLCTFVAACVALLLHVNGSRSESALHCWMLEAVAHSHLVNVRCRSTSVDFCACLGALGLCS